MTMVPVESSHINQVGFNEETKELTVEYSTGTYIYEGCSKQNFEDLLNAPSKGRYINDYFRGVKYRKVG